MEQKKKKQPPAPRQKSQKEECSWHSLDKSLTLTENFDLAGFLKNTSSRHCDFNSLLKEKYCR